MDLHKRYKKKVLNNTNTLREKETLELQWYFENVTLKTMPSVSHIQITDPDEYTITETTKYCDVILEDITNNDKKALDEKNMYTKISENIDVGCYIYFDSSFWLVIFKEHKTINDKKHFIVRRCNQFVNYKYKGKVYKIPVSIENLTMYSDGLADGVNISTEDAKRQIWYGNNPITRLLKVGTRVMLTHNTVFRITHINDFEFVGNETGSDGIIKALVLQTGVLKQDDLENNIAYNDNSEIAQEDENLEIIGSDRIYVGSYKDYNINKSSILFELEDTPYAKLENINDNTCRVIISSNSNCIGKSITLIAKNNNEVVDRKKILIIS